jgi:hypothetical protein
MTPGLAFALPGRWTGGKREVIPEPLLPKKLDRFVERENIFAPNETVWLTKS